MLMRGLRAVAAGAVALGIAASSATANPVSCPVNAAGGFVGCLSYANPTQESVRALHASGLPYRFQLLRPSTSSVWGWWQYNDLDYHLIPLSLAGTIVAQVDNLGSGNPSVYVVAMG